MKIKKSQLKEIVKSIVKEVLLNEEFQQGEWWIDSSGNAVYADGDVGDTNHEGYILQLIVSEILDEFGIESESGGFLDNYEEEIKNVLIEESRLSPEELEQWDDNSMKIILSKLEQFGSIKDHNKLKWMISLAYGYTNNSMGDARDFGMRYMGYKRVVTRARHAFVQTYTLTPQDLGIIDRGLSEILDEIDDIETEKLTVDIEVLSTQKSYHGIPLELLGDRNPNSLRDFYKRVPWITENERFIHEGLFRNNKEWNVYEGTSQVVAVFEDNSRKVFDIDFHNKFGEDKEKWRSRAASKWASLARKLHGDVQLSEVGNPIQKDWKTCFEEALNLPEMKEFIRNPKHKKVFDKTPMKKFEKRVGTIVDPINFTNVS